MTILLERQSVVGAKVEATEGVAETLAAADAAVLPYEAKFAPDVSLYKRTPHRGSLTPLAGIPGRYLGKITFKSEFKGSGAVATVPEWDALIRGCGYARSAVSTIAIGAVTGGPFQAGETITGGTSGATGRVVGDHANGVTALRYVVLTGVFTSGEVVTGGTSTATATTSGAPTAAQGYEYRPSSTTQVSLTMALWQDGIRHSLVGCRGTFKMTHKVGEPVMFEWEFTGAWTGTTDEAASSLGTIPYQEIDPAAWRNVSFLAGTYAAVIESLTVDAGNDLVPRPSANAATGIASVLLPGRAPTAEIDPEMVLVAEHDFLGRLRAGTVGRLVYGFGSGTGQRLTFGAPRAQYSSVDLQARLQGVVTARVPMDLVATTIVGGDDEIQIGMW